MAHTPQPLTGEPPPGRPSASEDTWFRRCSQRASSAAGSAWAFAAAVVAILVWAATGPLFHFSDTWQLVINTGTTIVTFLMVFLIQNTQNRDARAVHLKLDELLRAVDAARTSMVELEDRSDAELDRLRAEFQTLRERRGPARGGTAHRGPRAGVGR